MCRFPAGTVSVCPFPAGAVSVRPFPAGTVSVRPFAAGAGLGLWSGTGFAGCHGNSNGMGGVCLFLSTFELQWLLLP